MHHAGLVCPPRSFVSQSVRRHEFGHAVNEATRAGVPCDVEIASHLFGFGFEFSGGFHCIAAHTISCSSRFSRSFFCSGVSSAGMLGFDPKAGMNSSSHRFWFR